MDSISKAIEAVKTKLPLIRCRLNEPMKSHTSFKIGSSLRAMFFPRTTAELVDLCTLIRVYGIPPLIIGNGTNLLVDDSKPLDMIAVKTTEIDEVRQTGETEITAEAGVSLSRLALFAHECGLSGLEYAHGIPGSLGGAISINAGAYGSEMKDTVFNTSAFNYDTGIYSVIGDQHEFSYRRSRFSDTGDIILSSVIRLHNGDKEIIRAKMDELFARRRESQPLELPSAGSTFKRPQDGYAAAFIEQAGLKGYSVGGAQVSVKHAGFVVNTGNATFADIMSVIEHVKETVSKQFGVILEQENTIIMCGR